MVASTREGEGWSAGLAGTAGDGAASATAFAFARLRGARCLEDFLLSVMQCLQKSE
jgi:hypothetical protein